MRRRRGPGPRRRVAPPPAARRTARRTTRRQVNRTVRRTSRRQRRRPTCVGDAPAFGIGALACRLGKNQTQQSEQQYGRSVEEMTDEELESAVQELNLRKEPLDAGDQTYLDQYPDYLDELERLGRLKEQGYSAEEEYAAKKQQLLGL